jgi:hypothetical protein
METQQTGATKKLSASAIQKRPAFVITEDPDCPSESAKNFIGHTIKRCGDAPPIP